jgi:predicted SnoaL-like aldol condensation-catalyzing enzyme
MTAAPKVVVRRWLDEVGRQDQPVERPAVLDADFICHEPAGTWSAGPAVAESRLRRLFDPAPMASARRQYCMVAEGDTVAVLGMGHEAAGRPTYSWVQVVRVRAGRIAETWFPGYVRDVDWGPLPAEPEGRSGAEAANRQVVRRWWEEMYAEHRFDELMPALAGPAYIRHESTGTWTATVREHLARVKELYGPGREKPRPQFTAGLLAEGDKVAGWGTMRGYRGGATKDDEVYSFVQLFRLANGRLVETWFPAWVVGVGWSI